MRGVDGGNSTLPCGRTTLLDPTRRGWRARRRSVGQHEALQVARDGEHLMAILDDVYMATDPDGVGPAYATVQDSLCQEEGIRIHVRRTKVCNAAGIRPAICDVVERVAHEQNPSARVWRGAPSLRPEVLELDYTMLELPGARGSDGDAPPSHEVEWECRFAGLAM